MLNVHSQVLQDVLRRLDKTFQEENKLPKIQIGGDPTQSKPLNFGASDQENTGAKEAISRRVLTYYHPSLVQH